MTGPRPGAGWGGPPEVGHGGVCSRGGLVQRDAPPVFFSVLPEKKTGRARSKRKGRLGALRCSGPPRDGGRRIGACSDFAWPSGTLGSSARSMLPSRGGWCGERRGARTHLTSFSFRAFRFATRSTGSCGGSCFRADALVRPYSPKLDPLGRQAEHLYAEMVPGGLKKAAGYRFLRPGKVDFISALVRLKRPINRVHKVRPAAAGR